jgi:hypothetical protein
MTPSTAPQYPELPLDHAAVEEPTLRWAHARSGLDMSFEQAMANPLIAGCLRNVVRAARQGRQTCS